MILRLQQLPFHGLDLKGTLWGWGSYMAYLAIYCLAYTALVEAAPINFIESIIWVLREWGVWLLLTLIVCKNLRCWHSSKVVRSWQAQLKHYSLLIVAILGVSLAYRVSVDVYFGANPVASVIVFAPKHMVALAVVMLAWHLLYRASPTSAPTNEMPAAHSEKSTLLVCKGADECLIEVGQIDAISAAGNYVDIFCGDQQYLLRATLLQMEESLPQGRFVRIHRSHLVSLCSISRIKSNPSGNGSLELCNGKLLPVSKKGRTALRRQASLSV